MEERTEANKQTFAVVATEKPRGGALSHPRVQIVLSSLHPCLTQGSLSEPGPGQTRHYPSRRLTVLSAPLQLRGRRVTKFAQQIVKRINSMKPFKSFNSGFCRLLERRCTISWRLLASFNLLSQQPLVKFLSSRGAVVQKYRSEGLTQSDQDGSANFHTMEIVDGTLLVNSRCRLKRYDMAATEEGVALGEEKLIIK